VRAEDELRLARAREHVEAPRLDHLAPDVEAELRDVPGLLSPVDGPALALYCLAWQELLEATAKIEANGMVSVSEKGAEYQHPLVGIRHKAMELIAKIGAKFGMTPSDRAGLKPATKTTEDELSELISCG